MGGVVSSGVFVWVGGAGRWRGVVGVIFEGFTSRPGVRRGSLSRRGRGRVVPGCP